MPSKEELLQSIRPGMKLDKAFFLRVYGYELTWPGFKDQAIGALEAAGCSRAQGYYETFITEYEAGRDRELREAAQWYVSQMEKKRGEEQREKREKSLSDKLKQSLSELEQQENELRQLLERMT